MLQNGPAWPRGVGGVGLRAFNHDGEFRNQSGNSADRGEHRRKHHSHGRDGYRNLDEGVTLQILDDDAPHVSFVNQRADFIDQVSSEDLEFFDEILKGHAYDCRLREACLG